MAQMGPFKDIGVDIADLVATIEIRRPPHNFFDIELIRQIADACEALDKDDKQLDLRAFARRLSATPLTKDERRRAVAAVHAGWRGTAARIAAGAVAAMGQRFGTRAEDLHAAIGPGIGQCCYEVGAEVAERFGGQGRGHIDLAAANRRQLEESGVTPRRIYASNLCTMCRGEEFDSFRRDREKAGRMYSFAGIR